MRLISDAVAAFGCPGAAGSTCRRSSIILSVAGYYIYSEVPVQRDVGLVRHSKLFLLIVFLSQSVPLEPKLANSAMPNFQISLLRLASVFVSGFADDSALPQTRGEQKISLELTALSGEHGSHSAWISLHVLIRNPKCLVFESDCLLRCSRQGSEQGWGYSSGKCLNVANQNLGRLRSGIVPPASLSCTNP